MITNLFWLAINIYHEARGEPFEGKVAVAHVTLNRVHKENRPIKEVVKRPYQFSWYNGKEEPAIAEYDAFVECMKAAYTAIEEQLGGENLQDADHYFADYIPAPKWAASMKFIKKIGRHLFYKS